MTVYAIAKESWEQEDGYPSRFKKDVFAKKSDAIVALREIAREAARRPEMKEPYVTFDRCCFELEFENDEARITWLPTAGKDECSKVLSLRVEKLQVPKGRIVFDNGRAIVKDWEKVLTKDPRFRAWDYREWISRFRDAMSAHFNNGESEYSLKELKAKCDWWKFMGVTARQLRRQLTMLELVYSCPWFMDHPECAQIHLEPGDWADLLRYHPEFADRCKFWDDFSSDEWKRLLAEQPQFADKCDWGKMGELNGNGWKYLLTEQPQFADHCDWGKLGGGDWRGLITKQPQFADKCDWGKLDGRDWCELLIEAPTLEKHFVRESLRDGTAKEWQLCNFLQKFPKYIPDCNLGDLGSAWPSFLVDFPDYADQCDFTRFKAGDWRLLLLRHPELTKKIDWSIDWRDEYSEGYVLLELLDKVQAVYNECQWSLLRGDVAVEVLLKYPEVAEKINWGVLSQTDWFNLLLRSHQYGDKCNCWEDFTAREIGELLESNNEFIKYARINDFSSEKITDMLISAPTLDGLVDLSRIDNAIDRMRLCVVHSQFFSKCLGDDTWKRVKSYVWESLSGPVVVIPLRGENWITKFPTYPKNAEHRAGLDRMSYYEARKKVDEILSFCSRCQNRAVAIDGAYVDDESESNAREFALLMKEWFSSHKSSIKILYLECGYVYDTSVL